MRPHMRSLRISCVKLTFAISCAEARRVVSLLRNAMATLRIGQHKRIQAHWSAIANLCKRRAVPCDVEGSVCVHLLGA